MSGTERGSVGDEQRTAVLGDVELSQQAQGDVKLRGLAARTGVWYPVAHYEERIEPGAFKRSLNGHPDVTLLVNHDGLPLSRSSAGTLRLWESDQGLEFEARLDPRDPMTLTLQRKLSRGDLNGECSFAFRADQQSWSEDFTRRTLKAVNLARGDVSIVTNAANEQTWAEIDPEPRTRSAPPPIRVPNYTTAARVTLELLRLKGRR